jgi:type IV pilus assembly protein PilF
MRRFTAHGTFTVLAMGWIASGLLGCATLTGGTSDQNARKAASRLEVGTDHLANGRSALALREFLAAEKLDPNNARVHYALADAYLARGKRAEAERHARRSLDLFPDYHDARLFLSALLLMDKRYAEAVPECDRLIDDPTFPSPWRALTNRAWAEYKLGRAKDARESLSLAREYQRNYWPSTLALAILEGDAGRRPEAIRLYQEIIAQNPGPAVEAEVNYRLAEVYVALGKRREAVGHLTTSVARAPESQWAKKSQEYLKRLH